MEGTKDAEATTSLAGSSGKQDAPPAQQQQQQDAAPFLHSAAFTGAKEGYVFTTGAKGTGYYRDAQPTAAGPKPAAAAPAAAPAAKGKPVVLKSSSIVKVQRRPGVQPDPKKRKTAEAGAGGDAAKPSYVREMERYRAMDCSADTQHDRPLVK